MRKMFQYRIYPTRKQVHKLNETLDECRWLYNHLLEKRKHAYAHTGKGLSCYEQQSTYPLLKQERPTLEHVHSQVLQNVAVRIDLAFKAFFRRVKQGENPGFPRFRGRDRYDSFTFPQSGFSFTHDDRVTLSKIGSVKMVYNRPLKGKVVPAYTSQDCSRCHHRQKMPLSERMYHCPCCLLSIDRDLNAALNMCGLGLHSVGLPLEAPALAVGSNHPMPVTTVCQQRNGFL